MENYTEFAVVVEAASVALKEDIKIVKAGGEKTRLYQGFENFLKTTSYIQGKNPYSSEYVVGKY